MKKIPKKKLDEAIELSRRYWASGDNKLLVSKIDFAEELAKEIGVSWLALENFIDGIVSTQGMCSDAENDEIYCALRCIGWMPVDE